MRSNFIGALGSEVARPAPRGEQPTLSRATLLSPLLCFLAGATLALLLPLVPAFVYRETLPPAAFSLLLDDTREPRVTHVSVQPPACAGGGSGVHIHMLISSVALASKLALTLPSNMRALGSALGTVYLLTSPEDDAFVRVAAGAVAAGAGSHAQGPVGVEVFQSRTFTHRGAKLNMAGAKSWLHATAVEACSRAGRSERAYLLSLDVDILLPHDFGTRVVPALEALAAQAMEQGVPLGSTLYGMQREFYASPADGRAGVTSPCPPPDRGGCEAFLGYFQLFSAATRARFSPWSADVAFYDNHFKDKFANFSLLPGMVAHLGKAGGDWTGLLVRDDPTWETAAIKGYTYER